MADIREILKALGPEDKTLWQQCRTNMRSVYLNAHNSTVGIAGWRTDDDAFLDLIDIKLVTLFERAGRLESIKDVIGAEDAKTIEANIEKADDDIKSKPKIVPSDASKLLSWGQNG